MPFVLLCAYYMIVTARQLVYLERWRRPFDLMHQTKRRYTGVLVRGLFAVLLDYPDGLPINAALQRCLHQVSHSDSRQVGEQLLRGCVAPMKAGWLVMTEGKGFAVSQEGKLAYQRYSDPDDFLLRAGKHSLRGWISIHFPEPYFFLGKLRDQFASEYRVAKRIGIKNLLEKAIGTPASWQEVLPVQTARRIDIADLELSDLDSFLADLKKSNLSYGTGGHAVYLPPETIQKTPFRDHSNQSVILRSEQTSQHCSSHNTQGKLQTVRHDRNYSTAGGTAPECSSQMFSIEILLTWITWRDF